MYGDCCNDDSYRARSGLNKVPESLVEFARACVQCAASEVISSICAR